MTIDTDKLRGTLDNICEAFSRVIEAHHIKQHPFHSPIDDDAQLALRELRGFSALLGELDRLRELWAYYQSFVREHGAESITQLVVQRDAAHLAGYRLAQEQAEKLCEEHQLDQWNLYKGRKPYTGSEDGRADPHVQGESCGAEHCAVEIRAMQPPAEWGE